MDKAHPFLEFKNADTEKSSKSSDALRQFIEQSPERQKNLFRTFLGFVVSGIVLQLADRHGKLSPVCRRTEWTDSSGEQWLGVW